MADNKIDAALKVLDDELQRLCAERKKAIEKNDDTTRADLGRQIADLNLKLITLGHSTAKR